MLIVICMRLSFWSSCEWLSSVSASWRESRCNIISVSPTRSWQFDWQDWRHLPETLPLPRLFSPHPQPSKTAILKRTRHVNGKDWSIKPSMFLSSSPKEPTAMHTVDFPTWRQIDATFSLQLAGDVNMPVSCKSGRIWISIFKCQMLVDEY